MAYSIGMDFGTESGRVLLFDLVTATEVAVSVVPYQYGAINRVLPGTGQELPPDWALQHPEDWLEVINRGIPDVIRTSGVSAEKIIGIGIDFTSCTVLPVDEKGVPLCLVSEWSHHPHAWPKLWKHHAAQPIAEKMNSVAEQQRASFLHRYGGRISSEWYFPKLIEVFSQDRRVYEATYAFVEAVDWIVWQLTGVLRRSACTAGYKAMWLETGGLPSRAFFIAVHEDFTIPDEKLGHVFYPVGSHAGTLTDSLAKDLGLRPETAVAVGTIDAHASAPGLGVVSPGKMVLVMGTSTCHLILTEEEVLVPGITGVVKGGIIPDWYGYEAGQAAVGDMFAWFVKNGLPEEYHTHAHTEKLSVYEYLEKLAAHLEPGQTGLLALDWWNGNRSVLGDANLSGVLLGLGLATRPEDIYRALLESTAFGTKMIVDRFREFNVPIEELVISGGIALKSPLLMQIYADICQLPVTVRDSMEVSARGAALLGAVAAGLSNGGFDSIEDASTKLMPPVLHTYQPDIQHATMYERIYRAYKQIYDLLGSEHAEILHTLKKIRLEVLEQ
jgi:L-ribulokinase